MITVPEENPRCKRRKDILRVMIVDNSLSFRELFKDQLSSQFPSMEVIDVENGGEALKYLALYPVDLIFMDIRMPGENGLELTKRIKAEYKDVGVAILTLYDSQEYREAAIRCGASYFIPKGSSSFGEIAKTIKRLQEAKDSSLKAGGSSPP
jgi:DNA-binding NarL/FixJ family response regulator